MPSWVALVDTDEDNNAQETQIIKKHLGRYLVDDSDERNISWWKWSFKENNFSKAKTDEFRKVTQGFDDKGIIETALNRVCKREYEKTTHNHDFEFNYANIERALEDENFQNLLQDIWTYCSIGNVQLLTLKENGNERVPENIHHHNHRNLFVSTKSATNLWWWAIREKEFKNRKIVGLDNYPENKTRSLLGECSSYYYNQSPTIVTDENAIYLCGIGIPMKSIYDYID